MSQTTKEHRQKKKSQGKFRLKHFLVGATLVLVLFPLMIYLLYRVKFWDTIFPNIHVLEMDVSGLTQGQAQELVEEKIKTYLTMDKLRLQMDQKEWELPLTQIEPRYYPSETALAAYIIGRRGNVKQQIMEQWQALTNGEELSLNIWLNEGGIDRYIATLSAQIEREPIWPVVQVEEDRGNKESEIKVIPGENGMKIDGEELRTSIRQRLEDLSSEPIKIETIEIEVNNNENDFQQARETAEKLVNKQLRLRVDDPYVTENWTLSGKEMISFIQVGKGFNQEKMKTYILATSEGVNREPQNAKFNFKSETNRVEEFVPAKNGLKLEVDESVKELNRALETLAAGSEATQAALVVTHTKPEISLENANTLGINELLGRGTSTYKGSIPTRVHNVALAASRINGTLVKPGESFSFNEAVGDVSGATGYQQAYIIRNGRTELGDGGGVCQDSTTVFRAALNAGLPITERKAHAYRVGYYEQDVKAGIDATVYAPSPDLKFTNDTPAHILIQAEADTPNRALIVEIYGTSDGRKSEIKNHVVWDITPPPPDIYQDDPSLKIGTVKQVDWKAGGAKAKFDYVVTRNGEILHEKTFYSTYKPWAAVYLRGVAP